MGDMLIIGFLVVAVGLSLVHMRKHFRGGGCCGSGSNTIREKKELTQPKIGELTMTIQGMHCENCQARVENALNRLDGVVCRVNLRKKTACVAYSREPDREQLKQIVEKLGYQVAEIR